MLNCVEDVRLLYVYCKDMQNNTNTLYIIQKNNKFLRLSIKTNL